MVKILFFRFRVTNSRLKNKKFYFDLLTWWVHFFCHIRVTNVKLINEKISLDIAVSKWHGLPHSITFFVRRLICWKCICDIYLSMLDFNGSCKFSNIFTNKITTADLCNYNGRQIKRFNLKWFNCELINRAWVDVFVKWLRLVLVYRRSYKFNNNLRTSSSIKDLS